MSSENEQAGGLPRSFARSVLPWLVLVGGLVLYLATLNPWVTLGSLVNVGRIAGWDWQPSLAAPLYWAVTYPLRWLPAHVQPVALNVFSAVCAALALALLARTVALLPHDRTRDQRQREEGEFGLLSKSWAWVPPLIAVLACALQAGFWEHAVSGTGEMLDILLLAYVARCLAEYRVRERDSWLVRMSFAYGLAVTNNWAMIGLLPVALGAVVWLKRADFFNARFFLTMLAAGVAGLLLYLLLPLVAANQTHSGITFWQAMTYQWGMQKQALLFSPFRQPALLAATVSLLPLLLLAIRWPSSMGDMSPLSNLMSTLLFRLAHLVFFVAGLLVLVRPAFLEDKLDRVGVPFLSLTYLTALCLGYFAGYLLLVFGVAPSRAWARPGALGRGLSYLLAGAVAACVLAVPAVFGLRNYPRIQAMNSPVLLNFAARLAQSVPAAAPAPVLLSDQPAHLLLLRAYYARQQKPLPVVPIHTAALSFRRYHEHLLQTYPDAWVPLPRGPKGELVVEPISHLYLALRMKAVGAARKVYYAHSSFGYYFEIFQPVPSGLALEMRPDMEYALRRLAPGEIEANLNFWTEAGPELEAAAGSRNRDHLFVAQTTARTLNFFGTLLQQGGRLPDAAAAFNRAAKLNPDNVVAKVNLDFNAQLQKRDSLSKVTTAEVKRNLDLHRGWENFLLINGPFDEPVYAFFLGQLFTQRGNLRQAAQLFLRCKELNPASIEADLMLAQVYLQAGKHPELAEIIRTARQSPNPLWKDPTNSLELVRLEALSCFAQTNRAAGEGVLQKAIQARPKDLLPLAVAANVYLLNNEATNALAIIERQLQLAPDDAGVLFTKGVVLMQLGRFAEAITPFTRLLDQVPGNYPGRMNRAIAYLQLNKLDEARKDYLFLRQSWPTMAAVHFGLGEIAFRKQDRRAAIKHYEDYLKNAPPGGQEQRDVEARLKKLKES